MNILVTGCNGQLGNEIQLLEKDHSQHVFFNTDIDELDITNQSAIEAFVEDNKIDGIINCAAYTAVDKAEDNDRKAERAYNVCQYHFPEEIVHDNDDTGRDRDLFWR